MHDIAPARLGAIPFTSPSGDDHEEKTGKSTRVLCGLLTSALLLAGSVSGQLINTSELSENGWYSDDTRADGTGSESAGTNLVSDTLTDAPEGTTGTAAHDADFLNQVLLGAASGAVPLGTFKSAAHMRIGPSGSARARSRTARTT